MKKVAIVTATRAEYGILTPLIQRINNDRELELDLIVTGTHLSEKHGNTEKFIRDDGFPIAHKIPILEEGNTPYDISVTMANAIVGFARCFREDRPDIVIILGDRTEMLGIASAAMNERIPIAHLHGGEVTEGAVDDCIRHALTKMSYLHFAATEVYRKRIIQLGEEPDRVFYTGALGTENILRVPLLPEKDIRKLAGVPEDIPYAVVTFHPVTLEVEPAEQQVYELCRAMEENSEYFYLITMANADVGGDAVNAVLKKFADSHDMIRIVSSLGMQKYLSAVKYASFVLGNSSSGILEAPVMGVPTVNIGDRQRGRMLADTVVNCQPYCSDITDAIKRTQNIERKPVYLFGDGNTSSQIVSILKDYLLNGKIDLKKKFFDIGSI